MLRILHDYNKALDREENASKHINIVSHYDDDTLIDKSGKLIKIIKLSGLDFVTQSEQALDIYKIRRNNWLKSFSSEFSIYFWEVRRKVTEYPDSVIKNKYAKYVNESYKAKIKCTEMYRNELYIALITKQPEGVINKGINLFRQLCFSFDKSQKQEYLTKRHKELNDYTRNAMNVLSDYKPKLLSVYCKNKMNYSAPLEFLSTLINFDEFPIPLDITDAAHSLPRKRLFFNHRSGFFEICSSNGNKKYGAIISIKNYEPITYQGIFDELGVLKVEYVISQSFRFYDRQGAKAALRDQKKEMLQSKEESVSHTNQIDSVFDDTASGEIGYGLHHYTLACYANTKEELNKHIALIISRFSDLDIVAVREDVASECGFWAQLPGNFGYITRPAPISTRNMAAFASLHNYSMGKLMGNYWGEAVSVFETLSGSPYYFNFHYKDVGNFLVFGAMGSGKTVLVGFLILMSMKFGGKRIIFDKDRGLEILVRAMGGMYEVIKPGIVTGFNPCQLDDTLENRKFLSVLIKKMLSMNGNLVTDNDLVTIDNAIDGMYRLDKADRQFCNMVSFFGSKNNSSLRVRFNQWCDDGAYAWLFDNAKDNLNLEPEVIGIDLGKILDDEICKTPALMYLTYRIEKALEGHRGILFCDEGWKALSDEYFKSLIDDWSRTPRKKNNIFGLATQVVNDTVNGSVSKSINESSFCKIFFPNLLADRNIYINKLGLSEHEYELVKSMPDDKHYFLLNYGRGTNKESVVIRLNLEGLENVISVISARESTLILLDQIRSEVGDDPNIWLPIFYERSKGLK